MRFLSPVFFTTGNVGNVLAQSATIAVLAIGQLLVILTGGIDLSVGSNLALASVVGALAFAEHGGRSVVVILVMLFAGVSGGFVNGFGYVCGRLPHPFIVTLATLSIARGLALQFAGGQPLRASSVVQTIGGGSIRWIPNSAFFVSSSPSSSPSPRRLGRGGGGSTRSAGVRRRAAHRHPANSVLVSVYVLSGLLAGVAAIVTSGRLNAGSPTFGELGRV